MVLCKVCKDVWWVTLKEFRDIVSIQAHKAVPSKCADDVHFSYQAQPNF